MQKIKFQKSSNSKKILTFCLILITLITVNGQQAGIQTLELSLSAGQDGKLTTMIQIGGIQQQSNFSNNKVQVDICESQILVCCKQEDSIFQKVYYFLGNPFFQIRDYSCKTTDENHTINDTAFIPQYGLIDVTLKQEHFPICSKGKLGLSNHSYFLSILPNNLHSFTIFRNPSQYKQYTLKLGQDTSAVKEYSYFPTLKNRNWSLQSDSIKFNQVLLGSYPIFLNSNSNLIYLPSKLYDFVQHQLVNSFECKEIKEVLYCPCQTGLTTSYPSFIFSLQKIVTLEIKPETYMVQDAEICKVQIKRSIYSEVEVNILFFSDFIFKFDPVNQRIGVLKNLNDQSIHEVSIFQRQKIKLPLQLILNCLVILLLCIFLALVLIEIIKRVSGLAEVREEILRVDIRDNKNYEHFA